MVLEEIALTAKGKNMFLFVLFLTWELVTCSLAFRVYFVCFIVGLNMLFFSFKLLLPLTSNIISLTLFSTDFWPMHSFSFPWFPSSLLEVCQCLFFSHRMKFMAQITEVPCVL